uniref:Lamin L3 n=1 Tax=Takifugu rubripes TaxID=31033 RepID=A0A674N0P3_TAKRU
MASATSTPAATSARSSRSASRRSAAAGLHVSSMSPTCQSRSQEKDDLRHLNDRLANYIQRVQELESERSCMLLQLEEKDESKSREMGNVRRLYEEELADVRRSLDEVAGEKARLQIDCGNLCDDNKKLQVRCRKKEGDLTNALAQWRNIESALISKDAEYSKLLSENRNLSGAFSDLQNQLENVRMSTNGSRGAHKDVTSVTETCVCVQMEGVLSDSKKQLTSEILRRVEMENQVQTLKEQLELQRNISEQELLEVRSRHESRLVEVDSGRQREFESKLAEAMQQLRQDHERQLLEYKEEMHKTFSSRLQTAEQAASEKSDAASATREELETIRLRVESLSAQLHKQQKDKMVLEAHCQDLQRTLDRDRDVWQQKLHQKDEELLNMRSQMLSQLEDYESLLDVKLALDMEINAYRKMLEVEEQRLHLSPSPSQPSSVARTHEHGCKVRGKKRKREGVSGGSPACKLSSRSSQKGCVSVAEVDVDGKYVRLKNHSDTEQPLGGWVVRRVYPLSGDISFHIPSSCILEAGRTLTIWAAAAEAEADPGDLVLQSHRSWGPITDVRVSLLNPNREEVAERRVSLQSRADEDAELDFDEDVLAGAPLQHFQRKPQKKKKCCSVC